jgi:archaellum biogenesis protein FlaJ (TadC family)
VGRLLGIPLHHLYVVTLVLAGLTYYYSYLYVALRTIAERVSASRFLAAGRALSERFISLYITGAQVFGFLTSLLITVGAVYGYVHGYIPLALFAVTVILAAVFGVVLVFPTIYVSFTTSTRKTSCEVELPFLLLLFRVLSSTHITLYDMLSTIERSRALRAWSEEVRSARRLASVLNTSLLTAMGIISENHPSRVVRDVFRRILSVSISTGYLKDVVERAFGHIYAQLEARLGGLVEKFTIVYGVLVFALLFTPVVFAVVAPLYGGSPSMAFLVPVAVSVLFFFTIYAVVSSVYPSAFAANPPRVLTYASVPGFAVPLVLVTVRALATISGSPNPLGTQVLALAIAVALAPCTAISELWLRRVALYDRLVRLVSDAISVSVSLGENFVSVLERLAPRYGRGVEGLARRVLLGYHVEPIRERVVREAPSLYHATFLEALFQSLLMGAKPEMLKSLAESYEQLVNVYSKLHSLARTQELLMLGLAGMVSVFLGYVRTLFTSYLSLLRGIGSQGGWSINIGYFINFNPATYEVLTCSILVSLVFASVVVGKLRGGSALYCFRTMLVLLLLFIGGTEVANLLPIKLW